MNRALVFAACVGCSFTGPPIGVTGDTDAGDVDGGNEEPPWLDGWSHRREITLLASQIVAPDDGALASFPVLITLVDDEISGALPDRSDIVFTKVDAITPIEHELESIATGQLVAWVKIESLEALTDTTIFVYYGNPTPPVPAPQAVWTESFHAVYHLQQDPGPNVANAILDSSSTIHHGTAEPSMAPEDLVRGQIGLAIELDGTNDCIDLPALDVGTPFTVSLWMNMRDVSEIRTLLSNSQDGNDTNGFRFFVNSANGNDRRLRFETGNGKGDSDTAETPELTIEDSEWLHIAAIVDRTAGSATLLVNGVLAANDTSIRTDFSTSSDLEIGRMESNNAFAGMIDQLEIASTARPIEWLQTAHTNQRAPRDFYTLGDQVDR